ncbi:hypothetical protein ACFQHV_13475 [Promicromonospora thailandica]|uniref:Uncharacterized protein n=1 Tax=Promicromonospora thailandica TaxID=765201 RepID=A0A9X2G782_9MICO|nr:hypothetical protein [Promicromonospora thailandica]MCP2266900.1 hypothetical protein [Promicromonospora thailandica]BFF16568.1 hypothetical protein GCM10025730_00890 [Promicromonospora thailandica]
MTSTTRLFRSTPVRFAAIGLMSAGLCAAGAGMAFANPTSAFGQVVGTAAHSAGIAWSDLPEGYTQAQYDAFWDAGFTASDLTALEDLWNLETTETKSRAGQAILDGEALPFEPGTYPDETKAGAGQAQAGTEKAPATNAPGAKLDG